MSGLHLSTATFAYPEVPGPVRADMMATLQPGPAPESTFLLATCLRIEVAVDGGRHRLADVVDAVFGPGRMDAGMIRSGEDAATHLFRVAAGLESPIVGEREILTQFRRALADAEEAGSVSGLMAKLLEAAVATGRAARDLFPRSPHDSMAAVAAQVVGAAERVAVIGSGVMAQAVVSGLLELPAPPEVVMLARKPDVATPPGVQVWPMSRTGELLAGFPAVVSATSATHRLLPEDELAAILLGRARPVMLVDMAMPPDLEPPPGAPVVYIGIDELARRAGRRPHRHQADEMVKEAAAETHRRCADHHAVGPVIGDLIRMADEVVERTVERFVGRLGNGDDRAVLRQTAHTVARTLLASPVSYLRSNDRPADAADLVAASFGLDGPE